MRSHWHHSSRIKPHRFQMVLCRYRLVELQASPRSTKISERLNVSNDTVQDFWDDSACVPFEEPVTFLQSSPSPWSISSIHVYHSHPCTFGSGSIDISGGRVDLCACSNHQDEIDLARRNDPILDGIDSLLWKRLAEPNDTLDN